MLVSDLLKQACVIALNYKRSQTLDADTETTALELLNDLIAEWIERGINLNLVGLLASDTLNVSNSVRMALRYNLAVLLFENYSRDIPPSVFQRSQKSFRTLQSKFLQFHETRLNPVLVGGQYNIQADQ